MNAFSFDKVMITLYQLSGCIVFSYPSESFKCSIVGLLCLLLRFFLACCGIYFQLEIEKSLYESSSKVLMVVTYISSIFFFTFIICTPAIMFLKRKKIFQLFLLSKQRGHIVRTLLSKKKTRNNKSIF